MRDLVHTLCSDRLAGRAAGTEGGRLARLVVRDALRDAGLDPQEQALPRIGGGNVLAAVPGDVDRHVLLAAHFDHLGRTPLGIYRGADDNAAAVAVVVEVARALAARPPEGRGVLVAAFDAEEPPHFDTGSMGSNHFVAHPTVPLDRIDLMVCLELVGHALGRPEFPVEVQQSVFLLGAERSEGTPERLLALPPEPGLVVRPLDAEVIPPLSDYLGFWARRRPFVLLTGGRSRRYHTVDDTPEHLDWRRIEATARWLERLVRDQCRRPEAPFVFRNGRDDLSTLESLRAVLEPLGSVSDAARLGLDAVGALRAKIGRDRRLPDGAAMELLSLVGAVESGLAG